MTKKPFSIPAFIVYLIAWMVAAGALISGPTLTSIVVTFAVLGVLTILYCLLLRGQQ